MESNFLRREERDLLDEMDRMIKLGYRPDHIHLTTLQFRKWQTICRKAEKNPEFDFAQKIKDGCYCGIKIISLGVRARYSKHNLGQINF